jgi:prefoldin subunit 5
MTDPVAALSILKERSAALERSRAKAEAELAQAEKVFDSTLTALEKEFGVHSVEEATEKLATMEAKLTAGIQAVAQKLKESASV